MVWPGCRWTNGPWACLSEAHGCSRVLEGGPPSCANSHGWAAIWWPHLTSASPVAWAWLSWEAGREKQMWWVYTEAGSVQLPPWLMHHIPKLSLERSCRGGDGHPYSYIPSAPTPMFFSKKSSQIKIVEWALHLTRSSQLLCPCTELPGTEAPQPTWCVFVSQCCFCIHTAIPMTYHGGCTFLYLVLFNPGAWWKATTACIFAERKWNTYIYMEI